MLWGDNLEIGRGAKKKPNTARDKGSAPTLRGGTHFTRGCLRWARSDSDLRLATRYTNERTQTALPQKARTPSVERHIFFHGAMEFQSRVPRKVARYKAWGAHHRNLAGRNKLVKDSVQLTWQILLSSLMATVMAEWLRDFWSFSGMEWQSRYIVVSLGIMHPDYKG